METILIYYSEPAGIGAHGCQHNAEGSFARFISSLELGFGKATWKDHGFVIRPQSEVPADG